MRPAVLMMLVAVLAASMIAASEQGPPQSAPSPEAARPNSLTWEERGDICMARKNFADAADYYARALNDPSAKKAELWNKLGIAYQQVNKFRYAQKAYMNAAHTDKTFAEAFNNIGTLYFMTKKYGKSVGYFQRALKLRGDVAVFHLNLGSAYYHLKRYPPAVHEYRAALALDPAILTPESGTGTVVSAGQTDVEYYFYMAKALASMGNADLAVRYLRRALEDGYKHPQRIKVDPDFKKISQYPAFVELMRNPPVAIRE